MYLGYVSLIALGTFFVGMFIGSCIKWPDD